MDFKKHEKALNKAGYFISFDQLSNQRGDVVGQMDPYGEFHCKDEVAHKAIFEAMQVVEEESKEVLVKLGKPKATKKRGTVYVGNKSTKDINEDRK